MEHRIVEKHLSEHNIVEKHLSPHNFTFQIGEPPKEIMRIDEEGMIYKGTRIEDAGEAYRAFLEVMSEMKK